MHAVSFGKQSWTLPDLRAEFEMLVSFSNRAGTTSTASTRLWGECNHYCRSMPVIPSLTICVFCSGWLQSWLSPVSLYATQHSLARTCAHSPMCWNEIVRKNWACGARAGHDNQQYHATTFQQFQCAPYCHYFQLCSAFYTAHGVHPSNEQVPRPHNATSFSSQYTTTRPCRLNGDGTSACPHAAFGSTIPHNPGQYSMNIEV